MEYITFHNDGDDQATIEYPDKDVMSAHVEALAFEAASLPFAWDALTYHGESTPKPPTHKITADVFTISEPPDPRLN
jgi:hypothetical protein